MSAPVEPGPILRAAVPEPKEWARELEMSMIVYGVPAERAPFVAITRVVLELREALELYAHEHPGATFSDPVGAIAEHMEADRDLVAAAYPAGDEL